MKRMSGSLVLAALSLLAIPCLGQPASVAAWGLNPYGQLEVPTNAYPATAVAAGGSHSLALRPDGRVVAWGDNTEGQLNVPANATNVSAIAAGGTFCMILRSNGTIRVWGAASDGPTGAAQSSPVPSGFVAVAIAAGSAGHALAGDASGQVKAWGRTALYGTANQTLSLPPVKALAAGGNHNVALLTNGTVRTWWPPLSFMNLFYSAVTNTPENLSNVTAIAAGDYHTLALLNNGSVVAWGMNFFGETNVPADLTNAVAIAAGGSRSLALTADGRLVRWGLPLTDAETLSWREEPAGLTNVIALSASERHTLALTTNPVPVIAQPPRGRSVPPGWPVRLTVSASGAPPLAYQWERNGSALAGQTNASLSLAGVQPGDYGSYRVTVSNVAGAVTSVVAMLVPGETLAWGYNADEQCWLPPSFSNVTALAAGNYNSLAVRADGGMGFAGTALSTNILPSLAATTGVLAVVSGVHSSAAVLNDGSVRAFGDLSLAAPVPAAASNVVSAALGEGGGVAAAVRADGQAVLWGLGSYTIPATPTNAVAVALTTSSPPGFAGGYALDDEGRLVGFGHPTTTNIPASLTNVVQLAMSSGNASTRYALRADGTVVSWATNGTVTPVVGGTNTVAIAAGSFHLLMLREDGTVFATGSNQKGQSTLPGTLSNVVEVAAGSSHSLVRFGDGSPRITVQPPRRSVRAGSNTTLTTFAVGTPPLAYQWFFQGTNLAGATNASLTLNHAALADVGGYWCVITNAQGAVTSRVANVSVVFGPPLFTLLNPAPAFGTNGFSLRVESLSGAGPTILYASTNLVNWLPIFTNAAGPAQFDYSDPEAAGLPVRFYQAVEQR